MAYTLNGMIGVDVGAAPALTAQWPMGMEVQLSDGSKWRYSTIPAGTTIIKYGAYALLGSNQGVTALTSTVGLKGYALCIAQQAVVSDASNSQYMWFLIANPRANTDYKVRVAASCAIDIKLATTAYGGTLDDTTAGTTLRVDGIVLTDSQPAGSSGSRTFRTSGFPLGWGAV